MATKLFVGKLSFDTNEKTLSEAFAVFGEVVSVAIIVDRATNRSKGFGFVEMTDPDAAAQAIKALDGKELDGRPIIVTVAKPREENPRNNAGFPRSW